MKKRKCYIVVAILVVAVLSLSACSKAKDSTKGDYGSSQNYSMNGSDNLATAPQESKAEYSYDTADGSTTNGEADGKPKSEGTLTFTSEISTDAASDGYQDKIIRRVTMEVETKTFDDLITMIDDKVKKLGGYIEQSNITGNHYSYSDENRRGDIVVRIPKASLDGFVDTVSKEANVVSKAEETENVTLEYVDVESRKKSLEIEQERLFAILEKTDNLDNIITLENRLSDIRYELQKLETQLRTYDNEVEYSTVTLSISEVDRITPVAVEKKTVWQRISTGFSNSMYHIGEGFKNFFVWFVVNLPYLLIWAVIILIIVILVRRYYRKYNEKRKALYSRMNMNRDVPPINYPMPGPNGMGMNQGDQTGPGNK